MARNLAIVHDRERFFDLQLHEDNRGWFMEAWKPSILNQTFVQHNVAFSRKGVLRGMHSQIPAQGKYVTCLSGLIFDVVMQVNGKWSAYELKPGNSLWIPPTHFFENSVEPLYHGYQALEDSVVSYSVTVPYSKEGELKIPWNRFNVPWPITPPILSEKDK